jgi:hypothetical protein
MAVKFKRLFKDTDATYFKTLSQNLSGKSETVHK